MVCAHSWMPPRTYWTFRKPASRSSAAALTLRGPVLQRTRMSRPESSSCRRCTSSLTGIKSAPSMWQILHSSSLRTPSPILQQGQNRTAMAHRRHRRQPLPGHRPQDQGKGLQPGAGVIQFTVCSSKLLLGAHYGRDLIPYRSWDDFPNQVEPGNAHGMTSTANYKIRL